MTLMASRFNQLIIIINCLLIVCIFGWAGASKRSDTRNIITKCRHVLRKVMHLRTIYTIHILFDCFIIVISIYVRHNM